VKGRILQTLSDLRKYALKKGYEVSIFYHEEDSYLMRFANSAISLNTNEHLIALEITAQKERRRASYALVTNLNQMDEMKKALDAAAEMAKYAQPLSYNPTIPEFKETYIDEDGYDPALLAMTNAEKVKYFNTTSARLEDADIHLSGIFSNGANTVAQINTRSEHCQYFKTSDCQVTVVLSHAKLKWELTAEQSAQKKSELDPLVLHKDLAFLLEHYQHDTPRQIPLGRYDIVFGAAATAEIVRYMNWIGFDGGMMKRGFSFLSEENIGKKVFSEKFTLVDDPTRLETFPFKRDLTGIERKAFPLFKDGVFQAFVWSQDEADEFGAKLTGHSVTHISLVLQGGDQKGKNLEELVKQPRDNDLLYFPFLHYFNLVNPSKGVITGSSRFGALLLKRDGSVEVPYNVRITQSMLDIYGDKMAWLSKTTIPYNVSESYGRRNPTALIVPAFIRVNDLEISHSNSSY
jgi:predicted Zn-dependent protease